MGIASQTTSDFKGDRLSVKMFGARGDGVHDDTSAIQSAIDVVHASAFRGGRIFFPPGHYLISETINWKAGLLDGAFVSTPNAIIWAGDHDVPAIKKTLSTDPLDSMGQGGIQHFVFWPAGYDYTPGSGNRPKYWIEIDGNEYWDKWSAIRWCGFVGALEDCIYIHPASMANIHMEHLRFDSFDGFAIRTVIPPTLDGMSWSLDNFTVDIYGATPPGAKGVFAFDNTGGAIVPGVIRITNARIETNRPFSYPAAIICWYGAPAMPVYMENIYYQGVYRANFPDAADTALIWVDPALGPTSSPRITTRNVQLESITAVFHPEGAPVYWGLDFPACNPYGTRAVWGESSVSMDVLDTAVVGARDRRFGEMEFISYDPSDKAVSVRHRSALDDYMYLAGNGYINWQDGSGGVADVNLGRLAAGLVGPGMGRLYIKSVAGDIVDGGVIKTDQNGLYIQREVITGGARGGGLNLGGSGGSLDPERAYLGAGATTDGSTFTAVAEQASYLRFNAGTHVLFGANIEMVVDDGLTPNLGEYDPELTYLPTALFRAMSLDGVKSVQVGTDAGAYLMVYQDGVRIRPTAVPDSPSEGYLVMDSSAHKLKYYNGSAWVDLGFILSGSGSPEGAVTAPVGMLYLRTDGGSGRTLYVKESGSGNTGWAADAGTMFSVVAPSYNTVRLDFPLGVNKDPEAGRDLDVNGTLMAGTYETGLTASLPVKTDADKKLTAQAINLASGTEVSGQLPIAAGGTGAGTAENARTALSVYSKAEIDDIVAYLAEANHTHPVDITSANGGDPPHTHQVTGDTGIEE